MMDYQKLFNCQQLFWCDGNTYTNTQFLTAVANYRNQIAQNIPQRKEAPISVLLFDNNIFRFAVRLFALSLENITVILPPNDQQLTITELADKVDFVAGSLESNTKVSIESFTISSQASNLEQSFSWPVQGKLVFYTSGSSGDSKAIEKNWRHINAELNNLNKVFSLPNQGAFIATVSHQHIYGMLFRLLWPLANGCSIYQTFEYPEHAFDALNAHQELVLISSPAFLSRLLKDNVLAPYRDKLLAIYSSGGALIDSDAIELNQQFSKPIIQVYGSTETGGIAHRQVANFPTPNWQFFPDISVKIDADSQRLLLTSPYIDEVDALLEDRGELVDGKLKLLGRADRTIKLEEKRVNLSQMEAHLKEHDWVDDAKILLLTGKRDILGVVVKLNESGLVKVIENGNRYVTDHLKPFMLKKFELVTLPRKWRYLDEMPYNSQGKLPLIDLEKLFASVR